MVTRAGVGFPSCIYNHQIIVSLFLSIPWNYFDGIHVVVDALPHGQIPRSYRLRAPASPVSTCRIQIKSPNIPCGIPPAATPPCLDDSGDHDRALALVLVNELLAVATLLLRGPARHLTTTDKDEEQNAPAQSANQINADPRKHFKHVVGAGYQAEPESGRDSPFRGPRSTEITQNQVSVQVRQLCESEESHPAIQESCVGFGCRSGIGAEDPVSDIEASQDPIVGAILEDVARRHRSIAETVDEDGFELAFQEMDGQQAADEQLDVGGLGKGFIKIVVDERPEGEEEKCRNE